MAPKEQKIGQIALSDEGACECLEPLIRSAYERCHPDETLNDLKRRSRFSKEDKGLLRDWMALAAGQATARHNEKPVIDFNLAA